MIINNISSFLHLIRIQNILIIILTQCVVKFCLINNFVKIPLSNDNFLLLVTSTVLIACAGYIINDIYDTETDIINKKKNMIAQNIIHKKTAISLYYIINIIAVLIGIKLSINIKEPLYSLIFIFCVYILWKYSEKYQNSLLTGNLLISLITSLSIFNVLIFEQILYTENNNIFYIITFYSIFAFLISFVREVVKDCEDITGDKSQNSKNLVITYGIRKSKILSIIIILICFLIILIWQYSSFYKRDTFYHTDTPLWGLDYISMIYSFMIEFCMLFLVYKILKSKKEKEFALISKLIKYIMLIGILSIPLFTYLYFSI